MFDILPNTISAALGVVLPLYLSHRAQHQPSAIPGATSLDPQLLLSFLLYFSVLSLLLMIENLFSWITYLIPFYAYIRMLFILYLALPQTQGAALVYARYVAPFFGEFGGEIDRLINRGHDVGRQAGLTGRPSQGGGMFGSLGSMAGGMLGSVGPAWLSGNQSLQQPAAAQPTFASYSDNLLSRFRAAPVDGLAYGRAYGVTDPAPKSGNYAGSPKASSGAGYADYLSEGISQASSILSGGSRREASGSAASGREREREVSGGKAERRRVVSGGSYRSGRLDDSDFSSEEEERRRSGHKSGKYDRR